LPLTKKALPELFGKAVDVTRRKSRHPGEPIVPGHPRQES